MPRDHPDLPSNDSGHFDRLAQVARVPALDAQFRYFTVHIFFNYNRLQQFYFVCLNTSTETRQEVDNRANRRHIGVLT